MKRLTSRSVIRLLREEYETQLRGQLNEVDLFDSRGTLIISKDLKVIHKPSGYVYTVKGVTGEPGFAKVVLRNPEEPRVEPGMRADEPAQVSPTATEPQGSSRLLAAEDDGNVEKKGEKEDKRDYGKRAYPSEIKPPKEDAGETMFVVDQKEFEKHYREA